MIKTKKVEVKVTPGEFLDYEDDIISENFLSIFNNFPKIQQNKDLKEKIGGLFYDDIHAINISSYTGSVYIDFRISTLPGQCSTLLIHDIMMSEESYIDFIEIINNLAIGLKFSNILITLEHSQNINKILIQNGFEMFKEKYQNRRTGNYINYYMKYLN